MPLTHNCLFYIFNPPQSEFLSITASAPREYNPEAVVLALGAHPRKIKISGLEENHIVAAWEVPAGEFDPQEPVLVLGAGLVGCETAE
jgi:pyruvate/2-oxoglutarate dehydrogenase complex dihydrolipoamide dehydrogenase (E3) component